MPIDPSIVLGIKPVQISSPLDLLTKGAQLQNLISESRYRDQEAQTNQQKQIREQQQNAEADREQAAQKTEADLISKNAQTLPDGSVQINHSAVRQGLAAAGFGKQSDTYLTRVQIPDEKRYLENQKTRLANAETQRKALGGALQSLTKVPDEQLPAAYDQNRQELIQQGFIQPDSVPASADVLQQGGLPALRGFVQQHAAGAVEAEKQLQLIQKDLDRELDWKKFQQGVKDKVPKDLQEWTSVLGQVLGSAENQAEWEGMLKWAVTEGRAPEVLLNQFGTQYSPAAVQRAQRLALTPNELRQSEDRNKPIPGRDIPLPADVAAQKVSEALASRAPSEAAQNTLDREARQYGTTHSKSVDAANSQLEKIADARAMINGSAEAQALGIPKVVTALVGGQGSGVKITQPELNSIVKARGVAGDFQGFLNSISGKGKLADTQKQQLTAILDDVKSRIE